MALPPRPQEASQLGARQRFAFASTASHAPHHRSAVGCITVSRTNGGAGWWKPPSPDLARAPVEATTGATRHEAECVFGAGFMASKRAAARLAAAEARARTAAARAAAAEEHARAVAEKREKAAAEAQAAAAEQDPEHSVVPWLRQLGIEANEAREAAALCENMPDATLEQRVKAALRHFHAKRMW